MSAANWQIPLLFDAPPVILIFLISTSIQDECFFMFRSCEITIADTAFVGFLCETKSSSPEYLTSGSRISGVISGT